MHMPFLSGARNFTQAQFGYHIDKYQYVMYFQSVTASPIQLELNLKPNQTSDGVLESLAWVFKALSDPTRLKILMHLASGQVGCCGDGVCACDLEELTGLSQPTVSHHMKCLSSAGLVRSEKRGKWMYYSLDPKGVQAARGFLNCC
jgi:ArsR family transcriptional regulator, arsenate/arsenite/antimonite-responsive transcriptional repressor